MYRCYTARLALCASLLLGSSLGPTVHQTSGAELAANASARPVAPPVDSPARLPDDLERLEFAWSGDASRWVLRGPDAMQQLAVTAMGPTSGELDVTRHAVVTLEPPGVVAVDATGLITPLADGEAQLTATLTAGLSASVAIRVEQFASQPSINFPNQIVPIFTKLACNSGGCHGKASGQNGFKLSLLGFEPGEDYEYLVKESRGRRLFPAAPDRSLLLTKPLNVAPHGGGRRMDPEGYEYRLLRRWISQGMPYGSDADPRISRIEVYPAERVMGRNSSQQSVVVAHYTDGSVQDVTRMAQFEANNREMAEVSPTGLVTTQDLAGDVAIMARYQSQVAVFRATVPLGAPVDSLPAPANFIDEIVFAKLKRLGVPPSPAADDATFLRRVTLDVAGRLPTVAEAEAFLTDAAPNKRDAKINDLLDSSDYADYFANKWSAVLRNRRRSPSHAHGAFAFHDWIRESMRANKPYDQFVREIVAASGEPSENPPVVWYREVKQNETQVEDCAQLFLGMRLQCARCHHHPFEKWSQRDYYSFSAFFSRVARKPGAQPEEQVIFAERGLATAKHPKTGEVLTPAGLDAPATAIDADEDARQVLADWMSRPENPFFAPALVNRYWKHFFSRGLVDPEDDMRVTNPASNPELLDALSRRFVEQGFDLKDLIRTLCQSRVYQLASEPNEFNARDRQNFSRFYPKRLPAEVLLDSIDGVTGGSTAFAGLPADTRAVQLPDTSVDSYFLTVFGRPEGASACECERSQEANLAQSLHLLNSAEVQGKLSAATGRAALLAAETQRGPEARVREIYLAAFAREPMADELGVALDHLNRVENKPQAYEDIVWALVNTKEFLFNH